MGELPRPTTSGGDAWIIARKLRSGCFGLAGLSSPKGQGHDNPNGPLVALGLLGARGALLAWGLGRI
jgi:hypothetical protein